MHNLGPRETLEKFGNRNFPYFRPSAFSLLRERREIHACSGFRFAPREEDDPTFSFRPPTCARISSKVEIEGPVFPNSAPVEMQHSSFSPRVNIRGLANGLQIPRKVLFRSYRFESVWLRGADETGVNQTVSSRREREFSLKVEWKVRF